MSRTGSPIAQPRCVLVDLDRGFLAVQPDDLAGQRRLTDAHDVVQPHGFEPARDDDRPGDAPDLTRPVERLVTEPSVQYRSVFMASSSLAERDLVADRLAEHLQQPLPAIFGLVVRGPGRKRHHERRAERVESLAEWRGRARRSTGRAPR